MRHNGRITQWNDERGFGFVTPDGGGERVFVHIRAFGQASPRPVSGQRISYALSKDDRGRWTATDARHLDRLPSVRMRGVGKRWPRTSLALLCMAALVAGWLDGRLPPMVPLAYATLSAVAIALYAADKSAAQQRRRRTPESTLHMVALLGGWPGALFAQEAFRHKSRKASFQLVSIAVIVANVAALAGAYG